MEKKKIELRSESIQEIIGEAPPWLVRWGITTFFVLLFLLICISFLISYPDIVKAPFRLSSSDLPKSVVARSGGKMVKLLVVENQHVQANETLGYLESAASYEQVLDLGLDLDGIRTIVVSNRSDELFGKKLIGYSRLGELQSAYQSFSQAYLTYQAFLNNGFYLEKREILNTELADLISLNKLLASQFELQKQDFELAEKEYNIQKALLGQQVISQLDFQRESSKYLAKKMQLFQLEASVVNNNFLKSSKMKEILELDKSISEQTNLFLQAVNTMKSSIDVWRNRYLLTSPIAGKVRFSSMVQENQHIQDGQELFFIGSDDSKIFGEIRVPQDNFGKVKVGQLVVIKFASYPFHEFGVVEGRIEFISEVPAKDSSFMARVALPLGFKTTFNKTLSYRPGMTATAEIVTQDLKLAHRVLSSLRKATSR